MIDRDSVAPGARSETRDPSRHGDELRRKRVFYHDSDIIFPKRLPVSLVRAAHEDSPWSRANTLGPRVPPFPVPGKIDDKDATAGVRRPPRGGLRSEAGASIRACDTWAPGDGCHLASASVRRPSFVRERLTTRRRLQAISTLLADATSYTGFRHIQRTHESYQERVSADIDIWGELCRGVDWPVDDCKRVVKSMDGVGTGIFSQGLLSNVWDPDFWYEAWVAGDTMFKNVRAGVVSTIRTLVTVVRSSNPSASSYDLQTRLSRVTLPWNETNLES